MTIALYWAKNDLRLDDNPALTAAATGTGRFLAVYCIDARHYGRDADGEPRLGPHRRVFLRQSLNDLRARMADRGGRLLVLQGEPERLLPGLAAALDVERITAFVEIAPEECNQVAAVARALPPGMLDCHEANGLFATADLPFEPADVPGSFSWFRRKVEGHCQPGDPIPAPVELPPPPAALADWPDALPDAEVWPDTDCPYAGGETQGLARMHHYLWDTHALADYKRTRNGLLGPDFSSRFSPWLALGCISPRRLMAEIHRFEHEVVANESTYWLGFELLWREFFRWILRAHGAALFRRAGILERQDRSRARDDDRFAAWCEGRTGMPFVDANMRELAATGYMSNRGRQNAASFFARDLGQDWRRGAAWFESRLVDYDVASNWGNWASVAGVGTDRRDRGFDVLWQARRYDPDAAFVDHWLPELRGLPADQRHTPFLLPDKLRRQLDYPTLATVPAAWRDAAAD
ncbi:DASH family cryptochrome [Spectribacter hydrogenoxidans]|uniref:Cryptochrome DASH n=1 Tax=Spectribacter hydrogenoxidans TaxID=3075608 RepID=A0ABU3BVY1_9GAMM|nr:DASH family cryptochrome [Salinisphaera sp. W335]MDT0633449.1 DASH family cryptochrome [Salinisphaera sp. W335]